MAKKQKEITPFFELRFRVNDTLEQLAHELLMTMQAIETTIELGGMNDAGKKILSERLAGLKAVCFKDGAA